MNIYRQLSFASLALTLLGTSQIQSALAAEPTTTIAPYDASIHDALLEKIKQNKGIYSRDLGELLMKEAETEVNRQLARVGVSLSEQQVTFLHSDRDIYMACYGTIFPPDARIALNILELRKQLGEKLFNDYKQLAIAGAVTRRHAGLEEGDMREKEEYCIKGSNNPDQYRWKSYTVVDIPEKFIHHKKTKHKQPKNPDSLSKRKRKKQAEAKRQKQLRFVSPAGIQKYMAFLTSNHLVPSDTYRSKQWETKALAAMGDDAPAEGRLSVSFYKHIMVSQHLRPAERDPFPGMADYIRYLDSLPRHRFPIKSAPWPILFPLAKGWPLREARDIAKRHEGKDKLTTYGKYHGKREVYIARFKPFPWHFDSWQGKVQAGGVCHEMSSIGVGTLQALGIPSCKAGRPHHSFLITFKKSPHGYFCKAMQGAANGGWSQWGFADPKTERPIYYHQGLAASMNIGLESYIHTRIAVHLAQLLKNKGEPILAENLLASAAQLNPYNAQLWQAYGKLKIQNTTPAPLAKSQVLALIAKLTKSSQSEINSRYIKVLSKQFLPINPTKSEETNKLILKNLQSCEGTAMDLNNSISQISVALHGWEYFRKEVESAVLTINSKQHSKKKKIYGSKTYNAALHAIGQTSENPSHQLAKINWLKKCLSIAEKNQFYVKKKKGKKKYYPHPYYQSLHDALINSLEHAGKKKEAQSLEDALKAKLDLKNKSD